MSEAEKAPEALNTFAEIVSTFSHQVPGVEIGFDVLTGFALIFTALGYLFSSSKDRENTCAQELSKTSDKLLGHIQESEIAFARIETDKLNKHIVTFQNHLYFELTPSVAKWMSSRKAVEATKKAKELTQKLALVQVEFNKLSNISINEVSFKTDQSEEEIKEQEKKIEREKEDKNKKEKELIEKLRTILNLMKDLFEFINDADLALTYEMLDDKNSGFDKRILGFNAKVIAFLKKTKWPSLFVLVVGLTSYLLTSHPVFLIYIIGLIVSAVITAFLWSKHLHNDEGTSGFESKTGYFMPLKYGKISGKVTSKHPNGEIKSEANWIDGKQEGLETQWYDNGEKKSETNYVNGKKEGLETEWERDGKKSWDNNYKDGKREGLLTQWSIDGKKFREIKYKDGKQEGLETLFRSNGQKKQEVNFINGKREGLETWWHEVGSKYIEVSYINGKKEGLETRWHHMNGEKISEVNYVNGKKEGLETEWHESGKKKEEANFVNGNLDGLLRAWYENGQMKEETNFVNGNHNGSTEWYEDGQKMFESNYINGKQEGLKTRWHKNGQKRREINFVNGKEEGLGCGWHEDGQKMFESNYINGKQEGLETRWHKNGQKELEYNFVNNNVTFYANYNNDESNDQNGLEPQYDDEGVLTHYIEYKDGVVVNERVENKE
jgi:antitoxin component YwqK of YwqJK toxin-antitoxin module